MASAENRGGILCGLERMLCPQTVLCKGMAEPGWLASEGQVRERGSTRPGGDSRRVVRSQSRGPINGQGSGRHGLCVPWRSETQSKRTERTRDPGSSPACPVRRQAHLLCSLPMEEGLHIKGRVALEHIIDGPRQLMRQDRQGFPCAMFFL
jgi:hypothetical protein